jgi:hypothetical protein
MKRGWRFGVDLEGGGSGYLTEAGDLVFSPNLVEGFTAENWDQVSAEGERRAGLYEDKIGEVILMITCEYG